MPRPARRQLRDGIALAAITVAGAYYLHGSTPPAASPAAAVTRPAAASPVSALAAAGQLMPITAPATTHPRPTAPADSLVATAVRAVEVHAAPGGSVTQTLPAVTALGNRQVFLLDGAAAGGWLHVYLPTRPNGSTGWIRAVDVTVGSSPYRITVNRAGHLLTVTDRGTLLRRYPVAVGKSSTPTPAGLFFVTDRNVTGDPASAYGPAALGLSGHSDVLTTFGSGDGVIGIHGTDEPGSIGHSVSHGCIRLANPDAQALYDLIPAGTPVIIT